MVMDCQVYRQLLLEILTLLRARLLLLLCSSQPKVAAHTYQLIRSSLRSVKVSYVQCCPPIPSIHGAAPLCARKIPNLWPLHPVPLDCLQCLCVLHLVFRFVRMQHLVIALHPVGLLRHPLLHSPGEEADHLQDLHLPGGLMPQIRIHL